MVLNKYKKGITPVIAIVLLLMVTVGAVGVVYTQFQSLVGDPTEQVDDRQRNQNTDISVVRGVSNNTSNPSDGTVVLEIENTGSVARNTTSFTIDTNSPGNLPGSDGALGTDASNSSIINPGEVKSVHTGISFPSLPGEIEYTIGLSGSDKAWDYVCRPETSTTIYC